MRNKKIVYRTIVLNLFLLTSFNSVSQTFNINQIESFISLNKSELISAKMEDYNFHFYEKKDLTENFKLYDKPRRINHSTYSIDYISLNKDEMLRFKYDESNKLSGITYLIDERKYNTFKNGFKNKTFKLHEETINTKRLQRILYNNSYTLVVYKTAGENSAYSISLYKRGTQLDPRDGYIIEELDFNNDFFQFIEYRFKKDFSAEKQVQFELDEFGSVKYKYIRYLPNSFDNYEKYIYIDDEPVLAEKAYKLNNYWVLEVMITEGEFKGEIEARRINSDPVMLEFFYSKDKLGNYIRDYKKISYDEYKKKLLSENNIK